MKVLAILLTLLGVIPSGETFLRQVTPRDSILIADQLDYGIVLKEVEPGTRIGLADLAQVMRDSLGLEVLGDWRIDTLGRRKFSLRKPKPSPSDIEASLRIAPFEEGLYYLPPLAAQIVTPKGVVDTLFFEGCQMEVHTMPIDTATFEIHDIKGQIRYPLTVAEVVPYVLAFDLLAVIVIAIVCIVMIRSGRRKGSFEHKDPPYIIALRGLDKYRGDKYWAPDKQKTLYSGITDTLRTYIESVFDVNAEEMTTAEIFAALKGEKDITPEVYGEMKELFELSDFVKFAKATASEEDNLRAIPAAVRFVTTTYQSQLEKEQEAAEGEKEAPEK